MKKILICLFALVGASAYSQSVASNTKRSTVNFVRISKVAKKDTTVKNSIENLRKNRLKRQAEIAVTQRKKKQSSIKRVVKIVSK